MSTKKNSGKNRQQKKFKGNPPSGEFYYFDKRWGNWVLYVKKEFAPQYLNGKLIWDGRREKANYFLGFSRDGQLTPKHRDVIILLERHPEIAKMVLSRFKELSEKL